MNMIPQKRKNVSYVLKLVVILSAAVGTVMSAVAGRNSFMGGSRVFMYFTIQSNIAIAVICAFGGLLLLRNKEIRKVWYIVKLAGTVSITLTGVVFVVLLTPVLGDKAWNIQNTLTHVVVPAAAIADFFVTASGRQIKRKNVVYVIIPPMLYAIYAGIGYLKGWEFARGQNYPYFFLNWGSPAGAFGFSKELPYMGCVWWILLLLVLLIAVGWCYMALADRIGKRTAVRMLETVTPGLEDLWFRERLLADEETMSYNHAWGGTVPFPEEKWQKWYDHWIVHPDDQRYYRYLKDENGFVGEIAYRYDPEYDGYVANIIIFSAFRGKGYGAEGLELLCAAAKENGITVLYDDIAVDNPAVRLFLRHGFYEDHRTEEKIILKKDL